MFFRLWRNLLSFAFYFSFLAKKAVQFDTGGHNQQIYICLNILWDCPFLIVFIWQKWVFLIFSSIFLIFSSQFNYTSILIKSRVILLGNISDFWKYLSKLVRLRENQNFPLIFATSRYLWLALFRIPRNLREFSPTLWSSVSLLLHLRRQVLYHRLLRTFFDPFRTRIISQNFIENKMSEARTWDISCCSCLLYWLPLQPENQYL